VLGFRNYEWDQDNGYEDGDSATDKPFWQQKTSISKHPQKENVLIKFIIFISYTLKIEKLKSNIDIKFIMCHLQI